MTMPFYVSPERLTRDGHSDRAAFARQGGAA
jgi:hypothetical protein